MAMSEHDVRRCVRHRLPQSVRTGLVAAALALLTACASSTAVEPAGSVGPGRTTGVRPATSGGPTAAANRAAAQGEADRLVAAALLPPGAVGLTVQPSGLVDANGVPEGSQVLDTVRFAGVELSLSQTRAWFHEHPQPGLETGGSSSTTGPSMPASYGFQFDPTAANRSWGSATLDITMVAEGSGTDLRIDGVAQWIDPAPVKDTPTGPTGRVTVAGGCPTSDRGWTDIGNPDAADLDTQLLPDTEPTAALTCVYGGMNVDPSTLQASHELDAAEASAAAGQIGGIPLGSRGDRARSCPADSGQVTITAFSFPARDDVDIWQHTSGCGYTDNGHIVAGGG